MNSMDPGKNIEGWFGVLELCRSLGKPGTLFRFSDLQRVAKFPDLEPPPKKPGAKKEDEPKPVTGANVASMWCSKLANWRYLDRMGVDETAQGVGRKPVMFVVTDAGWACKERPSPMSILVYMIYRHQKACHNQAVAKVYESLAELVEWCARVENKRTLTPKDYADFDKLQKKERPA